MTNENPYTPPAAEISHPQPSAQQLKRPASAKWVLFYATLYFLTAGRLIIQNGHSLEWWQGLVMHPQRLLLMLYAILSWLILCFSRPRKLAYASGIICCLVSTIAMMMQGMRIFAATSDAWTSPEAQGRLIGILLFATLNIWLFFSFTFGLPSRRYYGIGSARNQTE